MSWDPRGRGRGRGGGDRGRGGGDRGGGGFRGGGDRGGGRGGGRGGFKEAVAIFRDPENPSEGPDAVVTKMEDDYDKSISGTGALSNVSINAQYPSRPGHGTAGRRVDLFTNSFALIPKKDFVLGRYNVEVQGAKLLSKKLKQLFRLLLELPEFAGVATDYSSMLVSTRRLDIQDGHQVSIPWRNEKEDVAVEKATVYTVRIVAPTSLDAQGLVRYLSTTTANNAIAQQQNEIIQALNVMMSFYALRNDAITSIGHSRHFSTRRVGNEANFVSLGGGLEALRGFFQSVRPATGRLLLNVNVSHSVFLQPGSLPAVFQAIGSGTPHKIADKIKGKRVALLHLPEKKNSAGVGILRHKSIFGLARPGDGRLEEHPPKIRRYGCGPKDVEFWLSAIPSDAKADAPKKAAPGKKAAGVLPNNAYITVYRYFEIRYPHVKLGDWPVVNVGNSANPSYLPAEVCNLLPGQVIKRRLDGQQTKKMLEFACRRPAANATSIVRDGRSVLGLTGQNDVLANFGVQIGKSLVTVSGRILAPPPINYNNMQNKPTTVMPRDGSWNMRDVKFHTVGNLGPWTYVCIDSTRRYGQIDLDLAQRTVQGFQQHLQKAGINASKLLRAPAALRHIDGDEIGTFHGIAATFKMFCTHKTNPKPKFVLVILPFADTALYNTIKSIADTNAGIHTVCVVLQKFAKPDGGQYFGNIALKFNLKAGGINQTVEPARLGIVSEGKTMVVGIDVTHPSPGSKVTAPSVSGMVASLDPQLGQWTSASCVQEKARVEMVSQLEKMFIKNLKTYYKKNKRYPENILIYRDGVSEGQYQLVLEQELPQIRNPCRQVYPADMTKKGLPKITIVICGKRHHTRFYPKDEANADKNSNCVAGTIVDRGVTESRAWDFFLQAHGCLKGTARPCHYYVIWDEIFKGQKVKAPHKNTADALEDLTNNMCHLFGRATKAVSLCPPAYYADLLCTRMRAYLSDQYDPTDSATPSEAGSVASSGLMNSMIRQIEVHPDIAESMYFI